VRVKADEVASNNAQSRANAVTEDEATVEHGDPCLTARYEVAVDVHKHVVVARVGGVALRTPERLGIASGHRFTFMRAF
jgi:hypothetical protein